MRRVSALVGCVVGVGGVVVGYVETRHGEAVRAVEKVEQSLDDNLVPRKEIELLREKLESDHEVILRAIEELKEKLR